jgi:glycosyltransferase involved in cell wall biosynthesis
MQPRSPKPRALFLTPEIPAQGQGGGAMRSESLLQYLRRDYEVDVVTFSLKAHSKTPLAKAVRNASRLVRGRPPLFDRYSGYEDQIRASLRGPYDVGVIEHFWCASYAPLLRPVCKRLVLDLHNIESELARTHAASLSGLERLAHERFAAMYRNLEREWLPHFDSVVVVSDTDLSRVRHPDIRIFPNSIPDVPLPTIAETNAIVFSGNLEYHPNIEAVRWFARDIWPRIQIPDAEWLLIGRNPEAIASLLHQVPRVRLTGPVDDAIAALAAGKVCVVPLLSGRGTRFKILEAWAAGRAVVSTTIGAEGLGARDGEHLILADDAISFADAIARLWNDPELRSKLGQAGRTLYEHRFTWTAAWRALDDAGGVR